MEWVILFAIICAASSVGSKIEKLDRKINRVEKSKKDFKDLVGKNVIVSLASGQELKGILKSYDRSWIEMEVCTLLRKNKKRVEHHFDRVVNVKAIVLDNE